MIRQFLLQHTKAAEELYITQPTLSNSIARLEDELGVPLIEALEADKYDLVFSAYVPGKDHLAFDHVLYQQLVIIAHNNNPLASRQEVSLSDLRGMRLITYRSGTPVGDEVKELVQSAKLSSDQFYDDEITLASMVASDENAVGLALNTLGLSPFENLSRIHISDVPDDFHAVYLAYKKSSYKTPAALHFIEAVHDFAWPPAPKSERS